MDSLKRYEVELNEEWRKWVEKIPHLQFKEDWNIKIIPPFGGAIARFLVEKGGNRISVYLDCFDNLGAVGKPYWEIYSYEGDPCRVLMNDTDELMKIIAEVLDV